MFATLRRSNAAETCTRDSLIQNNAIATSELNTSGITAELSYLEPSLLQIVPREGHHANIVNPVIQPRRDLGTSEDLANITAPVVNKT
jgi:hypothetical protein